MIELTQGENMNDSSKSLFHKLNVYTVTILFLALYWSFYWFIISSISKSLLDFPIVINSILYVVLWVMGVLYWKHGKIPYFITHLPLVLKLTPATGNLKGGVFLGSVIGLLSLLTEYILFSEWWSDSVMLFDLYNIESPILFIIYTIIVAFVFGGIGGGILEFISKRFNREDEIEK